MISKATGNFVDVIKGPYFFKFFIRLSGLYLLFRLVNFVWISLVSPIGYYSPFIDRYLNYVTWIKVSVLEVGRSFAGVFGVASQLFEGSWVQVENGRKLFMAWPCCGLEIMSFWAAFVLADTTRFRTKLLWGVGGVFCIWLINCFRVGFLILATEKRWQHVLNLDQHDLFNILSYNLVLILMYVYYKKNYEQFGAGQK